MQRWAAAALVSFLIFSGCGSNPTVTPSDSALFAPTAMRLHPIFTHLKDWTGDDKPDGIEALVELQDQFGDPVKASGTVIFELYDFQKHDPTARGPRVVNPWVADLSTLEAQRDRWNRTSRTYSFQLAYPQISEGKSYTLACTFQMTNGKRFFNQLVLEMKPPTPATQPATQPTTAPASQPTTQPLLIPANF